MNIMNGVASYKSRLVCRRVRAVAVKAGLPYNSLWTDLKLLLWSTQPLVAGTSAGHSSIDPGRTIGSTDLQSA